jgi:TolA-binding protein
MLKASSLTLCFCMCFGVAGLASAQQVHLPPAVSQSQGMGGVPVTQGDDIQKQQARAASAQRQVEIRRDSEKMAQLSQELNDFLQKSEGTMSLDAVKKAEQIEKLAHSVRSKLKQSL